MHQTSRLKLDVPDGADLESGFPADALEFLNILDTAVLFSSGTVSAIPAPGTAGRVYQTTDTSVYYLDTGSVWTPIMVAGPWQAITVGSTNTPGASPPVVRNEGDVARLAGYIVLGIAPGIPTIPTAFAPSATRYVTGGYGSSLTSVGPQSLSIAPSGQITMLGGVSVGSTAYLFLDGIAYRVS